MKPLFRNIVLWLCLGLMFLFLLQTGHPRPAEHLWQLLQQAIADVGVFVAFLVIVWAAVSVPVSRQRKRQVKELSTPPIRRRYLDVVLVQIEAPEAEQASVAMGRVAQHARDCGGYVCSMVSCLVVSVFGDLELTTALDAQRFIGSVQEAFGPSVKIVRVRGLADVGVFGSGQHYTWTFRSTAFAAATNRLFSLDPGGYSEVSP